MRNKIKKVLDFAVLSLVFAGINAQAAVILEDDFSSGIVATTFRAYESNFDGGWWKCVAGGGTPAAGVSEWEISGGVVANASTNAASGYPYSKPAEAALFQTFSNVSVTNSHLNLSFDYSVASGDTLYVHLWGYTGTIVTASGYVCNIEASANGSLNNGEASSGSGLDSFNLKDGITTGVWFCQFRFVRSADRQRNI